MQEFEYASDIRKIEYMEEYKEIQEILESRGKNGWRLIKTDAVASGEGPITIFLYWERDY